MNITLQLYKEDLEEDQAALKEITDSRKKGKIERQIKSTQESIKELEIELEAERLKTLRDDPSCWEW